MQLRRFLSQQKYFIETFQAMEIVLLKHCVKKILVITLAISSLFSSDLDKFKLETQIKSLKNVVVENKLE